MQNNSAISIEDLKKPFPRLNPSSPGILKVDGYLEPFKKHFEYRLKKYNEVLDEIEKNEGSLYQFAHGYEKLGFNETDQGIMFREWAPNAKEVYLMGDFNNWDRNQHKLIKDQYGTWEIFLPKKSDGSYPIKHMSKVKLHILDAKD